MSYYVLWEDEDWLIQKETSSYPSLFFCLIKKGTNLRRYTQCIENNKTAITERFYDIRTGKKPIDYPKVPYYVAKKFKHYIKIRKLLP
jgi:hypothetical protein